MNRRDLIKMMSVTTAAQYLELCPSWFIEHLKNPKPTFPIKVKDFEFNAGELTLITGRPSSGKTSFAIDIATDVVFGKDLPVSYFSIECSAKSLSRRFISKMSGVSLDKIRHGRLSELETKNTAFAASLLEDSKLVIDDRVAIKPQNILEHLRQIKNKPPLVVVDYLQLMDSDKKEKSRAETIQSILSALKQVAIQQNVSVLLFMMKGHYEGHEILYSGIDKIINLKGGEI